MLSIPSVTVAVFTAALATYLLFWNYVWSFIVWWFGIAIYTTDDVLQIKKKYIHGKEASQDLAKTLDPGLKLTTVDENTSVVHTKTSLRELLVKACPSIIGPQGESKLFIPTIQLINNHVQTLYNSYLAVKRTPVPEVEYEREMFENEDGSTFALDWCPPFAKVPLDNRPVVIMIAGIAGGSHEYYLKACVKMLISEPYSYRVLVINHRGCSRTPFTTRLMVHSGFTHDIRVAMNHVKQRLQGSLMFGVGFSMGANMLIKYVGEEGDKCMLTACASVSNPFDLTVVGNNFDKSTFMNTYVYNPYLTKAIVNVADKNKDILSTGSTAKIFPKIKKAKTTAVLDELLAESHNFKDRHDYHSKASSKPYLRNVTIPTLCLNSIDDPITPAEAVEEEHYQLNSNLVFVRTYFGGHLGFFKGLKPNPWHPEPVAEFFKAVETS